MKTKDTIDEEKQQEEELMMEEFSRYCAVSSFADYVERYSLEEMLVELSYVLHQRNKLH